MRHMTTTMVVAALLALAGTAPVGAQSKARARTSRMSPTPAADKPGWVSLFDGKTLDGWKAADHPESWTVKDGTLACDGDRSHLFYVGRPDAPGPAKTAEWSDFEAEVEVRTHTGANSGVYFHSAWQDTGWPAQGFEMQVNNRQPEFAGDSGDPYVENKKTGSLYGIRNAYKAMARDNEWFTLRLRVQGPRIVIHVNDALVVDYVEPEGDVPGLSTPLQKIGRGTFALQCHDRRSQVQYRRVAVRPLPPGPPLSRAPNPDPAFAKRYRLARDNFPLVDLRALDAAHAAGLEAVQAAARAGTGLFVGVTAAAGKAGLVRNDAGVAALVKRFGGKPLFLGLRAGEPGWHTAISPKAFATIDYVVLDGQEMLARVPRAQWGREDALVRALVDATVTAIEQEPIDVYGAPLFLAGGLASHRAELLTDAEQQRIIDAAVTHGVAFEINGRLRLPGEAFVRKARAAGARFTLGECDLGTPAGAWCFDLREKVGLGWKDMFEPGHAPPRGAK
jgi:hypothetical protein